MAIFGYIDDMVTYINFNETMMKGLSYLKTRASDSFPALTPGESGKVDIDGDNLFAINQMYQTKPMNQAKFEAHRRYIDLQYVVEGTEIMGNGFSRDCRPTGEYDEKNDIQFFTTDFFTPIHLRKNMLCILYPEDIHAPGLILDNAGIVKKTVIKVMI